MLDSLWYASKVIKINADHIFQRRFICILITLVVYVKDLKKYYTVHNGAVDCVINIISDYCVIKPLSILLVVTCINNLAVLSLKNNIQYMKYSHYTVTYWFIHCFSLGVKNYLCEQTAKKCTIHLQYIHHRLLATNQWNPKSTHAFSWLIFCSKTLTIKKCGTQENRKYRISLYNNQ